jgi:hypothetical protein
MAFRVEIEVPSRHLAHAVEIGSVHEGQPGLVRGSAEPGDELARSVAVRFCCGRLPVLGESLHRGKVPGASRRETAVA